MEKVTDLRSLLIGQMKKLYDAERQQEEAFHHFADLVADEELKELIRREANGIREQINRIARAFEKLNVKATAEPGETMKQLIGETAELLNNSAEAVSDAAQIMSLQQIKHYEIAVYGSVCAYARALGENEVADLLHENLKEEKQVDQRLTEMAEKTINERAKAPLSS